MNKADVIDESQVAVTGNFTLTANLPNGKNFSVSGYLYSGESMESINDRVDILHDVVDRQRTRADCGSEYSPETQLSLICSSSSDRIRLSSFVS